METEACPTERVFGSARQISHIYMYLQHRVWRVLTLLNKPPDGAGKFAILFHTQFTPIVLYTQLSNVCNRSIPLSYFICAVDEKTYRLRNVKKLTLFHCFQRFQSIYLSG